MEKSEQRSQINAQQLLKWLTTIELVASFIASVSLFLLMLIVCLDTLLRYIFNRPITGVYELSGILLIVAILLPLSYVQAHKRHIVVSVIFSLLPPRAQRMVNVVTLILAFAIFSIMTWKGGELAWQALRMKEYTPGVVEFPLWPGKIIVPLAGGIICVRLLNDIFRQLSYPTRQAANPNTE